ncbi:MAG: AsmA family protein, partial [Bacteroidales bacterium]|nr:AsmA family protein [Bacteroidales bacterium]
MKKLFKILGIVIIIIVILLLVLPFAFKGKLTEIAKTEINKNVNAQVDFDKISLSLFRSFPHFNMGIKNISITGKDEFEGVSLAEIDKLSVTIDLFSVFSGDNYEIRKINVIRPDLNLQVWDDGLANYDIAVESESAEESPEDKGAESPVVIKIKNFIISDGNLAYADKTQNINVRLAGLNHSLKGDLSTDFTNLQTDTDIKSLSVNYGGINYFHETHINYKAGIEADLKNEIYTLKKNLLKINELQLSFDGSFSMVNEDINIVLAYKTLKTDFKNIL